MTKVQFGVLAVLLGGNLFVQLLPPKAGEWEYKIASPSDENLKTDLETSGAAGWDLVFARRAIGEGRGAAYEMIYKRPR